MSKHEAGDLVRCIGPSGDMFTVALVDQCSPAQFSWHGVVTESWSDRYPKGMTATVPDSVLDGGVPVVGYTLEEFLTDVHRVTESVVR